MNVNGVTQTVDSYSSYTKVEAQTVTNESTVSSTAATTTEDTGVIYEPTIEVPTKTYKQNEAVIAQLKADAEERAEKLQNIVQQLITQQSNAYAKATDMWSFLREGNFTVDAATKAQAEEDISEDGYYGVEQTSDRIIDFATALTGGDTSKMSDMLEAFKKGYEQAEKTWGGELPEISKKTYDAVIEKFNKIINGEDSTSATESAN